MTKILIRSQFQNMRLKHVHGKKRGQDKIIGPCFLVTASYIGGVSRGFLLFRVQEYIMSLLKERK